MVGLKLAECVCSPLKTRRPGKKKKEKKDYGVG